MDFLNTLTSSDAFHFVAIAAIWLLMPLVVGRYAQSKGYNFWTFFLPSLFFTFLAPLAIAYNLPKLNQETAEDQVEDS